MVVMVTGGTGFFGRRLVRRLLQDPEVSGVVCMGSSPLKEAFRKSVESYADKFHFVRGDVSQLDDVLDAMKSFSVQKVVHLAYLVSVLTDKIPRANTKVNLLGTCNVFEAARLLGVSRVVYASSITVYGRQTEYGDKEITEEDTMHPASSYGLAKQVNEVTAAEYYEQYGMSIIGLRLSPGFGHDATAPEVLRLFAATVALPAVGKPASIRMGGSTTLSLVCASDVAEFTRILLNAPSPKYPVYNLSGPPVSLSQVGDQVRRFIPNARIEFSGEPYVSKLPMRISSARAKEEFGFSLRPLEDSVLTHINEARREAGLAPIKT